MNRLALLLIVHLPITLSWSAQDRGPIKEPEEINQVYFLDSTGDIRPLERQSVTGRTIQADGSEFRFVQGEPLAFVVRVASPDADPKMLIQFLRLTVKGESRVIAEVMKGSKKGVESGGAIPFEATEYGERSFKIKAKGDLSPGEYAFRLRTDESAYCFAVDPVKIDLK